MNRGVLQLQSSPVQQLMAENPNCWSINNSIRPPPPTHQRAAASPFLAPPSPTAFYPQFTPTSSPSSSSSSSVQPSWHDNQELPESWSQLLLGGLMVGDEEKGDIGRFQIQPKNRLENWEVKQENSASSYVYGDANQDFHHQATTKPGWSHQIMAAAASSSSPKSCVTSFSRSMLDFSGNKVADGRQQPPSARASLCNSSIATGGALKKARVQTSATQSTIKVRKEKLGDRITALHQLVSPFGKTDTASVLLEVIGYIRFLHSQIEALSLPYLGSGSGNTRQQQSVQGEKLCIFPEDPGQDSNEEPRKDLRSRGLCLVPVSCTVQVGSDNGADFWAPSFAGGFR